MFGSKMMTCKITIKPASWSEHERAIRSVRHAVFVLEQSVAKGLDFDGSDSACRHALAFSEDDVVGTGRMLDGHIGRIAVLKPWRGRGIGSALVQFFMDMAKQKGLDRVYLNAQLPAVSFYESLGFCKIGEVFMDAGIKHIRMERESDPRVGQVSSGSAVLEKP
jgi:predicted GNAT family N-acyltransferase